MAYPRNLTKYINQKGGVLIPVLLFSSLLTLGILVLLQTQLNQKKTIEHFKVFLAKRRAEQNNFETIQGLSLEAMLGLKSINCIQKIPVNLQSSNLKYDYYFQYLQEKYSYKYIHKIAVELPQHDIAPVQPVQIIHLSGVNQDTIYVYDAVADCIVYQATFKQKAYFQLVGKPVNSLYIHDSIALYKIDLSQGNQLELKLLSLIDEGRTCQPSPPMITRDIRGDGRLISVLTTADHQAFIYHESGPRLTAFSSYLDNFDHHYFAGLGEQLS